MEMIIFRMDYHGSRSCSLSMCWINMDVLMLVLGSSCNTRRPSSSDEQDTITSSGIVHVK